MIHSLILLITLILPSFAEAQTWPNAPTNGTLISDCPMPSTPCPGWFPNNYWGTGISDNTAPASPPAVIQHLMSNPAAPPSDPTGCVGGGDPDIPALSNVAEAWIGIYGRIDLGFQGALGGTNKVGRWILNDGFSGIWIEIGGTPYTGPFTMATVISYFDQTVNNCHLPFSNADCPGNVTIIHGGPIFTRGLYHRIEHHIRKSSTPTSRDGILQVWLDGTEVVNFRSPNGINTPSNLGLFSFQLGQAWAGPCESGHTNPDEWRFDHIRVMSCPSPCTFSGTEPDTTPPAPVTGITVE